MDAVAGARWSCGRPRADRLARAPALDAGERAAGGLGGAGARRAAAARFVVSGATGRPGACRRARARGRPAVRAGRTRPRDDRLGRAPEERMRRSASRWARPDATSRRSASATHAGSSRRRSYSGGVTERLRGRVARDGQNRGGPGRERGRPRLSRPRARPSSSTSSERSPRPSQPASTSSTGASRARAGLDLATLALSRRPDRRPRLRPHGGAVAEAARVADPDRVVAGLTLCHPETPDEQAFADAVAAAAAARESRS